MRGYRFRLMLYLCLLISITAFLSFSCFSTWKQIANNRKVKQELTEKYNELLENEETLEGTVVKLQDPEYVAKYAREKYLFSKEGEFIIDMRNFEE